MARFYKEGGRGGWAFGQTLHVLALLRVGYTGFNLLKKLFNILIGVIMYKFFRDFRFSLPNSRKPFLHKLDRRMFTIPQRTTLTRHKYLNYNCISIEVCSNSGEECQLPGRTGRSSHFGNTARILNRDWVQTNSAISLDSVSEHPANVQSPSVGYVRDPFRSFSHAWAHRIEYIITKDHASRFEGKIEFSGVGMRTGSSVILDSGARRKFIWIQWKQRAWDSIRLVWKKHPHHSKLFRF